MSTQKKEPKFKYNFVIVYRFKYVKFVKGFFRIFGPGTIYSGTSLKYFKSIEKLCDLKSAILLIREDLKSQGADEIEFVIPIMVKEVL